MSFTIETASREGAKVVIGIAGTSGSGKTYSFGTIVDWAAARRRADEAIAAGLTRKLGEELLCVGSTGSVVKVMSGEV